MFPYNKELVKNAKALRKNMTDQEKRLWYDFFKKLPITVRRQHNIENYIVDFYIASKKTVIEVDGLQHKTPEMIRADSLREEKLSSWGIQFLRYDNKDINENFNAVAEDILRRLGLTFDDLK